MPIHRITVLLLLFSLIFSCKKNEDNPSSIKDREEKTNTVKEIKVEKVKDITYDEISELYNKKDDTLRIVNYWATYCRPCIQEIPLFMEIQEQYAAKKVKVYYISTDTYSDPILSKTNKLIEKIKMQNTYIINDPSKAHFMVVNPEYDGDGIPYTVFTKGEKRKVHAGIISKKEFIETVESFLK